MKPPVKILYFSWIRERMNRTEEMLTLPDDIRTPGALMAMLAARDENGAAAFGDPSLIHIAVDQDYAEPDTPLETATEIAFFPPVTGG